jgi:hypothetical protein
MTPGVAVNLSDSQIFLLLLVGPTSRALDAARTAEPGRCLEGE